MKGDILNNSRLNAVFAAVMLAVGFLYWNIVMEGPFGFGITILSLALGIATLLFLRGGGLCRTGRSLLWLGIFALSALQFSLFAGEIEKILNFLFLIGVFVYWVCIAAGREMDGKLSVYIIGDLLNQLTVVPFSNFSACFSALRGSRPIGKRGRNALYILAGLFIFLPALLLVVHLLSSADEAFASLMKRIVEVFSPDKFFPYMLQFLLGIPIAFYLYGLIYGNMTGLNTKRLKRESMEAFAGNVGFAPRPAIYAAMTAFILVYLLFFVSQAHYLFSAFSGGLPEALTYAEYARQGFFELCIVAGINLAILTASYVFIKKGEALAAPKALRAATMLLCICTLLLIATAMSKMFLYIRFFGLTQLRVYTSWFMILLCFIFLITAIRQIHRFNATRTITTVFIVLFLFLCYGNVDGIIAKYHIERFEAGTVEQLDVEMLAELSDGAAPILFNLYEKTEDKNLKEALYEQLTGFRLQDEYNLRSAAAGEKSSLRSLNLQTYKAEQIKDTVLKKTP